MTVFPLLLLKFSAVTSPQIPPGTNPVFQRICQDVQFELRPFDFSGIGDFAKATKLAAALPKLEFTASWDDSRVPERRRAEFLKARTAAVAAWKSAFKNLEIQWVPKGGRMKIEFEQDLPPNPDSDGPAGAVFFLSPDINEPFVEAVIALERGDTRRSIEAVDVQNEIAYSIGLFLGLERSPSPGAIMWRHDKPYAAANRVSQEESKTVREILELSEALRRSAANRTHMVPASPQIFVEPAEIVSEPVIQGSVIQTSFQVFNRGRGVLRYRVTPDCGCFRVDYSPTVEPGSSGLVRVSIDTAEFPGEFNKALFIYSNDANAPVKRMPVRFLVQPLYKFLMNEPSDVVVTDAGGASRDVFLELNEAAPVRIIDARIDGLQAKFVSEPWKGPFPGGSKQGKGLRYRLEFPPDLTPGRHAATLVLTTDNQRFPYLRKTLFVQQGIAALPLAVFFGDIGKKPERAWILVTRPERDFLITKIESDHPSFRARAEKVRGSWEYKLVVEYDGSADYGSVAAILTLFTSDPQQPKLTVPVLATVR